jgi:hypothetical protein
MVAFNMTDLDPMKGGSISYVTTGTAPNRMFVVTYSNVPAFTNSTNVSTGQIVLYETSNNIEIHTTTAFGDQNQNFNGTQGIENTNGTLGITSPGRNNSSGWFPGTNTAYRFQQAYVPQAPLSISGNTQLCQGLVSAYQTPSISTATSYSWSAPFGWQGTSSTSAVSYTTGASGTISVTATYSCGTSPATTMHVNTIPPPGISINSASPTILCSGKTITISVSGADTYTLFPGAITGQLPFTDIPASTTIYSVAGTSTAGCKSTGYATVLITVNETPTVTVNSGEVCLGGTFGIVASGADSYSYSIPFPVVNTTSVGIFAYSVIGTSTNGCASNPTISSLTVMALPVVGASATRSSICIGETTSLTASGAQSYVWSHNSSTATVISVKPTSTTAYSVTGTDENGCENTAGLTLNVNFCQGLEEWVTGGKLLNLYPNPSSGEVQLETASQLLITIYDVSGKIVYSGTVAPGAGSLNLRELPPGQYFVLAVSAETRQQHVLIIN